MGDLSQDTHWTNTFIVPHITSFDLYDFNRAKIRSSLKWLVSKAFGPDSIPDKLKDPFYTDQYEQEHVKPPVVDLLLSAELYCRAGSLILKSDAAKPLLGHDAVIQALAQKGLYVTIHERLVTERDLSMRPIQMIFTVTGSYSSQLSYFCLVSKQNLAIEEAGVADNKIKPAKTASSPVTSQKEKSLNRIAIVRLSVYQYRRQHASATACDIY
ncbi:calmodulin-regulated spectrin-associated protein 2a isoform X1 [Tachysurus ichikawai]